MLLGEFGVGDVVAVGGEGTGGDDEAVAVLQVEGDAAETGRSEHVAVGGGTDGVETHRGEDVPSGHLTGIVVAGKTARGVVVLSVEDVGDTLDGLVAPANEVVEIGYLVTGLVAMPVEIVVEEGVELGLELLRTAEVRDETFDVVGDVPGVVAGGGLCQPWLTRIEN